MTVFVYSLQNRFPFGKDYGDEAAVNDTAAEVRALQRKGICVSAVFMGTDAGALKAEIIYGKEYTEYRRSDSWPGQQVC